MAIASRVSAAVVAVSVATAAVLTGSSAGSTAASGTSRRAAVNHHAVNIVVAISVDGLKPSAIRQLGPRGVPALYRMMREGSATLNARTLTERTVTLPNHISMVTGRRVDASAGGHGVSFNDDRGTTIHQHAREYVRSMFDVAHDRGLTTALYASKDKFYTINRSYNRVNGARDRVGRNEGRDKVDRFFFDTESRNVTRLLRRLGSRPHAVSFLHLGYPDAAGHRYGWDSRPYLRGVRAADRQVARILNAVDDRRRLRRHANVILTADHGGTGRGHSAATNRANYRIPFMVWGVGVARGVGLYALNETTRVRPGAGRPDYRGAQPIRNGDLGNLVMSLLDLPAIPGSLFNRDRDLAVR